MSATSSCERIQEAIVAGETLADGDAAHAAACDDCSAIATAARRAGERLPDHSAELARGFRARLLAGGGARIAARRRRPWVFAGLGAAVAVGVALWVTLPSGARRAPVPEPLPAVAEVRPPAPHPAASLPAAQPAAIPPVPTELDELLAPAARWDFVEEPLAPYRMLAGALDASDRDPGGSP